jgi:hypothetical protein
MIFREDSQTIAPASLRSGVICPALRLWRPQPSNSLAALSLVGKFSFTKIFVSRPAPDSGRRGLCTLGTAPAEFPVDKPVCVLFRGKDVEDLWGHEA